MQQVLTEICEYLNNYFWEKKIQGHFTIEGKTLTVSGLKDGQYFRIVGSTFNDGVHLYPATDLTNETFDGYIWAMAVPNTVIAIAADVSSWQAQYGQANSAALSPFQSESFSGYSYSKSSSVSGGAAITWQDAFAGRLNKYRKLRGAR